ncbi:amidohydrolase [Leadbetterella byssophila DSM 17132]|uniref:Amidohydrolase n=1 Tax=Leadbetterella byssophila (strain DSM 17132 / JCM 16389 / KACC 11308 / NBRC 106382 / 4M15) TaxID=649349 RepID=E4RUA4_LEAB4|nr:amidohydrolase family protein [Leadbetterella byssophila]ADQ16938.1 amidohydrolase [Leadbetterella byssophila DSM 17132]
MKKVFLLLLLVLSQSSVFAQPNQNGVQDKRPGYYLFKNATLHVDPSTVIEEAWLLVHDEKIEKVGKNFEVPKSTQVIDLKGKHVYPSFVDIYSDYGMPELKRGMGGRGNFYEMKFDSDKKGAYSHNMAIKPEVKASELFTINPKSAEELRKIGFGAVVSHVKDGIVRGNSVLVSLNDEKESTSLLKGDVSSHYSFLKGLSTQTYPVSLMGCVALLRQTYYDADWYKKTNAAKERNLSLEAFNANQALPSVFHATNFHDVLRVAKIGKEFGVKYIIKGGGDEYKRIDEIKSLGTHMILPLNFPKALDVEDPIDAENVSLADLKHWELAPGNPAALQAKGVEFSFTASDLAMKSTFFAQIQAAIKAGLSKKDALAALTVNPAKALKIEDQVGTIKNGLLANFLITDKEIFDDKARILENWVQGKRYVITDISLSEIAGKYKTNVPGFNTLTVTGEVDKPAFEFALDTVKLKPTVTRDKNFLTITYKKGNEGVTRLTGVIGDKKISGQGVDAKGQTFTWSAELAEEAVAKKDAPKAADKVAENKGGMLYPFTGWGNKELPKQEDLLIKGATVWTNEKEGKIVADVLVKNGKIHSVGKNLSSAGAKVIDGTGKHLTNGIIDEHSHIALFSINEVESVSSEVRQEDVINSEDINIYRQLAGGVTTSQLLHGSADCIGGQSAIIKLKWGESPDNLLIPNSPKFIKFALGENVKRGNANTTPNRYPITRMGVEQVFIDAFTRAIAYKNEWEAYNKAKVKTGLVPPKRDLELDALVEILNGERNITCHSYVQSEINMLMKVADSLGFKINTFTHILEGYKVADKMKARGINGSTFSDWWAYKMEVKEAIPFNAAILTKMGIPTAINSDDAEMARRLNQEAAKTVLYGGLTEEEAWKTVTLNPAKMLHLDNRLGSIKAGKDADLVLWTDNPLSIYAKPEKTIIDGAIYFDLTTKEQKEKELRDEKNRLVQILLAEKVKGTPTERPVMRPRAQEVHCDHIMEYDNISVEQLESFLQTLNASGK